jgi:hypothetical protein
MVRKAKTVVVRKRFTRRRRRHTKIPKSLHYNPKSRYGGNQIMPERYFTTLSQKVTGRFEILNFPVYAIASAVGGQFAAGALSIMANCPYEPFGTPLPTTWPTITGLPAQAAGVITYMNNINSRALSDTSLTALFQPGAYNKCNVLSTTIEWMVSPSTTGTNDDIIIALCPTDNVSAPPTTTVAIMQQRMCAWKRFHGCGNQDAKLRHTIHWHEFFGMSKKEFQEDEANEYSTIVNPAGTINLAQAVCFQTSIQTVDLDRPTNPVPFELVITHNVMLTGWEYAISL